MDKEKDIKLEVLQKKFGIENSVAINIGNGNLIRAQLKHAEGSSCEIYLNGAHVTSFKNSKGEELIFMSSKAIFKEGKAIRGGIPVCWPQFGPGELPQHGFARNTIWNIKESKVQNQDVSITLSLSDTEDTRKQWNNSFSIEYKIAISKDKLHLDFTVVNKNANKKTFSFTGALHTYIKVSDSSKSHVVGLKGLQYIDKVNFNKVASENENQVSFSSEVDRGYIDAPNEVKVTDEANNSTIVVKKENFPDIVVWNPWKIKCKEMADMGESDYETMVCAESAILDKHPIQIFPGGFWTGKTEISKL